MRGMHALLASADLQATKGWDYNNFKKLLCFWGGGKHLFSQRWRFHKAILHGAARCNNAGRMLARRTNRARCVSNALWQGARQSGSVVRNRAPRRRGRRTHKLRGGKHVRPGNEAAGHGPPPGGAAAASWASAGPPLRPAEAPPASNAAPDPWCPPPGRPDRCRQPPPHAPPLRGPPTRPFSGCPPRRGGGSRAQKPPPNSSGPSSRPPRRHRAARPCKPAPTGRGGRRAGAPPPRGTGPRCRRNGYQSRPSPPQPCTPEPPQKPAPRPAAPSGPTADQLRQLTPHKTKDPQTPTCSPELLDTGMQRRTISPGLHHGLAQTGQGAPRLHIPAPHRLGSGHLHRRPRQHPIFAESTWAENRRPPPSTPDHPPGPGGGPCPAPGTSTTGAKTTVSSSSPQRGQLADSASPAAASLACGHAPPANTQRRSPACRPRPRLANRRLVGHRHRRPVHSIGPGQSKPAGGCQPAPPPRGLASGPSGGPTPASRPRPAPPRYPPSQESTSPRTPPRQ